MARVEESTGMTNRSSGGRGRGGLRRLLPGSGGLRVLRLAALAIVLIIAAAVVTVTVQWRGAPSRDDLLEQAGLTGKKHLVIGVKNDHPGMALLNPDTKVYEGFDIDISYMIAADLGFLHDQVEFVAIETEDRARRQARRSDGTFVTVDLVIATYSITPEREKQPGVSFSAPYLRTEQTIMTRKGEYLDAQSVADFQDKVVCTTATSTNESVAAKAGVLLTSRNSARNCVDGLRDGTFEAVASDAAILAGFVHKESELFELHDIGLAEDELYGVNTGENSALTALVNLSLYESLHDPNDRTWEEAFETHLNPAQKSAGLQQIAIAEQPCVPKVAVREWPWEERELLPTDHCPL
ncbi:transporter substrate-binding domain-containing protein [Sphaerisporangium sp. B11E5]|uniref:transporter substrate-binding domain-containing protein n=1 Tax=Sphaerisporangium sp. B11E5 TaxID=3153563 RepID=UPI00325E4149